MSTVVLEATEIPTGPPDDPKSRYRSNAMKGIFLVSVTTMFSLAAVGRTFKSARHSGSDNIDSKLYAEAVQLGKKAFLRATLYNAAGFSFLAFSVVWATGARSLTELGQKMKERFPSKDGDFAHKFDNWPTKEWVRRRPEAEKDDDDDWN